MVPFIFFRTTFLLSNFQNFPSTKSSFPQYCLHARLPFLPPSLSSSLFYFTGGTNQGFCFPNGCRSSCSPSFSPFPSCPSTSLTSSPSSCF